MPRERPGDKFGTSQGHPGRLGRFMWKFTFKGQNIHGTDRTYDGTDRTFPRDRRDTNQGVCCQNSLCLLVFFFPHHSPTVVECSHRHPACCLKLLHEACSGVADVWEKDVWDFQAKSGAQVLALFSFISRVPEVPGKTPGSARHPSSRHPRPSDLCIGSGQDLNS